MKYSKAKIILLIMLVLTLVICGVLEFVSFYCSFNKCNALVGEEVINSYDSGQKQYLFLPSFAEKRGYRLSEEAKQINAEVMCSSNIGSIFIDTESGSVEKLVTDKNYKEKAEIRFYNANGEKLLGNKLKYIKGHGNTTFYNEKFKKKAFTIEFPDAKKYTLFANASDSTFLRNEVARSLEVELGVPYSQKGEFVDLYINGDYYGNYYLVRNIEIAVDSIDISSIDVESRGNAVNPEDITGGYIIEREFYGRFIKEYADSTNGFITDTGECFIIHFPKYCTEEENSYLLSVLNEVESAMETSYTETENLIDIHSFVLRYIAEEITENIDMGVTSAYFYKDSDKVDGKLHYAPGWDYDLTFGRGTKSTGLTLGLLNEVPSYWFYKLYRFDEVRDMIKSIYKNKATPYLQRLIDKELDEYYLMLRDSAAMDSVRWESMYCIDGKYPNDYAEYEYLRQFISERKEYLDSIWCE